MNLSLTNKLEPFIIALSQAKQDIWDTTEKLRNLGLHDFLKHVDCKAKVIKHLRKTAFFLVAGGCLVLWKLKIKMSNNSSVGTTVSWWISFVCAVCAICPTHWSHRVKHRRVVSFQKSRKGFAEFFFSFFLSSLVGCAIKTCPVNLISSLR